MLLSLPKREEEEEGQQLTCAIIRAEGGRKRSKGRHPRARKQLGRRRAAPRPWPAHSSRGCAKGRGAALTPGVLDENSKHCCQTWIQIQDLPSPRQGQVTWTSYLSSAPSSRKAMIARFSDRSGTETCLSQHGDRVAKGRRS